MPRRWLSMRGHRDEERPTQYISHSSHTSHGFDFAFGIKSDSSDSNPDSPDSKAPFVFRDHSFIAKQTPDWSFRKDRSLASRTSPRHNAAHLASRSESSCIGVACGSPLHPPPNFGRTQPEMSPLRHCLTESPPSERKSSFRKWRKLTGLFRPSSKSDKSPPQTSQSLDPPTHKLGVPIHKTQWRNPTFPPLVQDGFITRHTDSARPKTSHGYDPPRIQKSVDTHPISSLQVKAPSSPFDRYSVMFKNINATPQLGLHKRRSYTVDKSTPEPCSVQTEMTTNSPGLRRRVTSPNMSIASDATSSASKPVSSTTYSLFPYTPSTSRPQSQHRPSNSSLSQPYTAHGQVLPLPGDHSSPPKNQFQKQTSKASLRVVDVPTEPLYPSIDTKAPNPAALDRSRSSSNGDIFFDVKSLCGSNGSDFTQYEMTRPPSAEVQSARSKSNARKHSQRQSTLMSMPGESKKHPRRSASDQVDNPITLVKSLSSVSATAASATRGSGILSPRKIVPQHQQARAAPDGAGVTEKTLRRKSAKLKSEDLSISVPSPVLESIEETSPRTINSRHSIALITEGHVVAKLDRLASRPRANSNEASTPSPRLHKGQPLAYRSAMAVKDSKRVPLSQYAPKHTTDDLVRHSGFQPVQPLRSNTDSIVISSDVSSTFRRRFPPGRTCTVPFIYGSCPPIEATTSPAHIEHRLSQYDDQELPAVVAYVNPSAEISVARTVSLSRKASAQIMVSKPLHRNASISSCRSVDEMNRKATERLPAVPEVNSKRGTGIGQDVTFEMEASLPSSPTTLSAFNDFGSTLDVFPSPPMVRV